MIKGKDLPDQAVERWLAGAAVPPEPFAVALDIGLRRRTDAASWTRARARLQEC
jgi:hypothetical protein